jgi:hypothetical protein
MPEQIVDAGQFLSRLAERGLEVEFRPVDLHHIRVHPKQVADVRVGVKNVVLCNRRLPVNFRYALLATEIARRCNMSRRASSRHFGALWYRQR